MTRAGKAVWFVTAALAFPSALLDAQGERRGPAGIPPGHQPPPGQCRVWLDGVPPGRQPAPTDCATAQRQAARSGGRLLYGGDRDDRWDDDRDDDRRDRDDRARARDYYRLDDPYGYDYHCSEREWQRGGCDADWANRCLDRDRDGWCDGSGAGRYGRLPQMIWGPWFAGGRVVHDLRLWLPSPYLGVSFRDHDRDGLPEEVVWVDEGRRPVQAWVDHDRDGRADRVVLYRDGRPWRTLR